MIDLFAEIGGIRLAFENSGVECVMSSEIDKYACETYNMNFGEFLNISHHGVPQNRNRWCEILI